MSLQIQEVIVYLLVGSAFFYLIWSKFGLTIRERASLLVLKTGNVKLAHQIRPKKKSGSACSSGCACPSGVR